MKDISCFPNIHNLDKLDVPQAEKMLKTTFRGAAENLGRNGYTWGDWRVLKVFYYSRIKSKDNRNK